MGHPRSNMEDSDVECNLNGRGLAQEVSEEKNICMWPRDLETQLVIFW